MSSEELYPVAHCSNCASDAPVRQQQIDLSTLDFENEELSGSILLIECAICSSVLNLSNEITVTYYDESSFEVRTGYRIDHGSG